MKVQEALGELLRVSSDVTHAAVLETDGTLVATTGPAPGVAGAAGELWAAAQRAAAEGAGALDQLVCEGPGGATFMVAEGDHRIVAITGRRPVAGLVFYDLRTCLRDAFGQEEA